jgi:pimeloyl-ACP methyl ester carboxylesterase
VNGAAHLIDEATVVLPEVLAAAGVERPVLVGHSDGGTIALMYAAAMGGASGLIVEADHVFVEDVTVAGVAGARAAFANGGLRDRLARWHDHVDSMFNRWADTWLDPGYRSWTIEPTLRAVSCPVLVIQGEPDPYGTLAQVDAIRRGVGGAVDTLILERGGHAPHASMPDEVLTAMARFVARLTDGAR